MLLFQLIKGLRVLIFKACLQWETVISRKLWIVKPAALCWDVKAQLALEAQLNSMNSRVLMLTPLPLIVLARLLTAPTVKVMHCTDVSNMTFNLLSSKSALPLGFIKSSVYLRTCVRTNAFPTQSRKDIYYPRPEFVRTIPLTACTLHCRYPDHQKITSSLCECTESEFWGSLPPWSPFARWRQCEIKMGCNSWASHI